MMRMVAAAAGQSLEVLGWLPMASSTNLYTVLTLIVAPAVLTNASSVLALNTANRFGRVVDRSRAIAEELKTLAREVPLYAVRLRQLQRLRVRGQLLIRAQSAIYAALGSFVVTALVAVVGAALSAGSVGDVPVIGLIGLGLGLIATACLFYGCALIVHETRLALVGLRDDVSPFGEELPPLPPKALGGQR
jgi:hypothetical protein